MTTTTTQPGELSRSEILVRMNWAAGYAAVFGAVTGAVLTQFALTLGMPTFGFGVLAALPYLTACLVLPASYFVERYGHRKTVAVVNLLAHRALWLGIAAVPWLPPAWWWKALLVAIVLTNIFANAASPAITAWAADLVPGRLRGRYYALRGQLVRIITVPLALGVGWAMDAAQRHGGD